jgi:hypothetical protein
MQIQNRLVVAETELVKQGNVSSKLFPNEGLVVSPHRNDEVGSLDQLLGKLSLDVSSCISSFLPQSDPDPVMHRLRLGVDPGRADDAGCAEAKSRPECVLCCQTPKDVPRTHEQD